MGLKPQSLSVLTVNQSPLYRAFIVSVSPAYVQVEVDWEKIQAKIEMEFAMEREKAANSSVRSSVSIRR